MARSGASNVRVKAAALPGTGSKLARGIALDDLGAHPAKAGALALLVHCCRATCNLIKSWLLKAWTLPALCK